MIKKDSIQIGILIPTYNNLSSLKILIEELKKLSLPVYIINDGSTDGTKEYLDKLEEIPDFLLIHHDENKGKGQALLTGFKAMNSEGLSHAISMDSDGQHLTKDISSFLVKIKEDPYSIWIGSRNLNQKNVPNKSSFGNRFSNFWVWAQTGLRLPDTQSGFRSYPLQPILKKRYWTSKFEFEIEILIRNYWSGTNIRSVPITVFYPHPSERITHFRPFRDFFRISVLNTVLTLIALLWIHPLNFIKSIFKINTWKYLYKITFNNPKDSPLKQNLSVSFGVFMGIVPIWGFQLLVGIPLAVLLKLNKGLFLIGANISIFPLTPFWWFLSLKLGQWIFGFEQLPIIWRQWDLEAFKNMGMSFFVGGTALAIILSVLTFLALSLRKFRASNSV